MKSQRFLLCVLSLLVVFALVVESKPKKVVSKTVVLLDTLDMRQTYSQFFHSLTKLGHELEFFKADDPELEIKKLGSYVYDNMIMLSPKTEEFGGSVDVPSILEFIDSGRNMFIGVNPDLSDTMRDLATECGVEFDEKNTYAIDHNSFDASDADGDHTIVVVDNLLESSVIFPKQPKNVVFSGVAHYVREDNDLIFPVAAGSPTTYSHSPDEALVDMPRVPPGKKSYLVSALQARNDARVIFSGSLDMLSDKFFSLSINKVSLEGDKKALGVSDNLDFAVQLTTWAFHARGILRFHSINYHRVGESKTPELVTINEEIEYSVVLEELVNEKWVPYKADDVMLEWVMLDPYIRIPLVGNDKGVFKTSFKLPDVYGIFKFTLQYNRIGYTALYDERSLPVRPYRHNEYERFIPAAFPYYAGAVGFVVFSAVYLYWIPKQKPE